MNTITDVLNLLDSIATAITSLFGEKCEVVLHEVKNKNHDQIITSIQNGFVTGRKVGDNGNNFGMEVQAGIESNGNHFNYFVQTSSGKLLRSSSIAVRDIKGNIIGLFSINFDTTDLVMAEKAILNLVKGINIEDDINIEDTNDSINVPNLLEKLIKESIEFVGKPVAAMTKEDKIKGLKYLDKKGAFLIKKSGDRVAKFYDISKYTIYSYLENDE